jgi:predicted nucleic acid-binding protein
MDGFVLDVSACMPWCCEDEATAASEQLLQRAALRHPLHVPSIWPWEIMNAVAVAVRRQRIKPEQAAGFLGLLSNFDFHIAEGPDITDLPRLNGQASRHRLTAYDTAYLDLAKQLALPLATLDDDLKKAAIAEGLNIF